jgi:hypothetical protein
MVILMARRPSRIDLLELDIDVRLADLWREANDISEWSLEVVGAFMRAACPTAARKRPHRSSRSAPPSLVANRRPPEPGFARREAHNREATVTAR